jgi:hypothetical protein
MKGFLLIIVCLSVCSFTIAQQPVTWQQLSKITWYTSYIASMGEYYDLPRFSNEIKALNGIQITIKGFYMPIDTDGKMFALSANPSNMCFFCNGAGPESVMEISVFTNETGLKHMKTDKYIELKGILKLNKTDPNHLMYILKDAELVTVIK